MTEHTTELLPWMRDHYNRLLGLATSGKLAHAYLFGGQQGLGKLMLARHFAHYLLCSDKQGDQPCGMCRECQLIAAGSHPDLKLIQPEESSEIKIDQVREIIEFISKTSQRGGYKIVLVNPAEAMNIHSANALLKVLEEPSRNTLLVLVSHQPALLMATIRSRCHSMKFNRPPPSIVIPWLESKNIHASAEELLRMANNVPLRALKLADDDALHDRTVLHTVLEKLLQGSLGISEAAAECGQYDLEDNIEAMMLCVADILAHNQSQTAQNGEQLHDHDLATLVAFFQNRTKLKQLHEFYRELVGARRAVNSTSNPNKLLILESLFYSWAATAR
jgi:DNA polymerase-3 subunit delta'